MQVMKSCTVILSLCLAVPVWRESAIAEEQADYVFKNGAIYATDTLQPKADAVAIRGKYISYMGGNDGAEALVGKGHAGHRPERRDAAAGFYRLAHPPHHGISCHRRGPAVRLRGRGPGKDESLADVHPDANLIRGFGWRYTLFPTTGPTTGLLDQLFPDDPCYWWALTGTVPGSTARRSSWPLLRQRPGNPRRA